MCQRLYKNSMKIKLMLSLNLLVKDTKDILCDIYISIAEVINNL